MRPRIEFRAVPDDMRRVPAKYPNALPSKFECLLDGQPLDVWVMFYNPESLRGDVEVLDEAAAARLRTLTVTEACQSFNGIDFPLTPPGAGLIESVQFSFYPELAELDVCFRINPTLVRWDKPWSFVAVAEVVESLVQGDPVMRLEMDEGEVSVTRRRDLELGIAFIQSFRIPSHALLETIWQEALPRGLSLASEAIRRLDRDHGPGEHSVEQLFEFPVAVRAACEQYLLYFVQFLRDLGVEADAALSEHANRVLFSVTPRSGPEALRKIREALDSYLALPESPEVFDTPGAQDIAVQQLAANVLHLRGQLQLAGAILAARSAQIEALEIVNAQLRRYALPAGTLSQAEEEPVVPGILSVMPFEANGVRVHLPEILRRLKRRFGD